MNKDTMNNTGRKPVRKTRRNQGKKFEELYRYLEERYGYADDVAREEIDRRMKK